MSKASSRRNEPDDPIAGMPEDLARVLRDQSIVVPRDQAIWELIASWRNAPSDTASAGFVPDLPPVGEMTHELKCWPAFFSDVLSCAKTFEVRKHDRPFTEGDTILLREFDPARCSYTGRETRRVITYILLGGEFGIASGYCVLGLGLPFSAMNVTSVVGGRPSVLHNWDHSKWLQDRLGEARARIALLEDALHQIAAPKRPDGTYNLSREACELLARKVLDDDSGL